MFARLAGRFLTGCKPEILQCKAMRRDKKEVLPALRTLTAYATLNFFYLGGYGPPKELQNFFPLLPRKGETVSFMVKNLPRSSEKRWAHSKSIKLPYTIGQSTLNICLPLRSRGDTGQRRFFYERIGM